MFDEAARDQVRAALAERAASDVRIGSAALLGSLATDQADRWSDLDLSLGVAEGADFNDVVEDWTGHLVSELGATVLLDLTSGGVLYRVFLLPGWLQLDLSFSPGGRVLQGGPRLRLLFGSTSQMRPTRQAPEDRYGWGVIYARHAYVCLQRERWWQAAFCVTEVRHAAMDLACLVRGLPARFARAYDDLPGDVRDGFEPTIFAGLEPGQLVTSLRAAIARLTEHGADVPGAGQVNQDLLALSAAAAALIST